MEAGALLPPHHPAYGSGDLDQDLLEFEQEMMEAFGLSIHGGTAGSSETWLASSSDQAIDDASWLYGSYDG